MKLPRPLLALASLALASTASAENWNQFRGPALDGVVSAPDLPVNWNEGSIRWKSELKGTGQSSPAQWGERLFLTGASADGTERYVMCLSAADGSLLWEDTLPCPSPEAIHNMNSRATPSCATDGEIVVAFFGPAGLHAWDLAGKKRWGLELGSFPGTWGVGASPVIVDGLVIQNCDSEGVSRLVAVEISSGKIVWDTPRPEKPKGGWSTPTLIEFEGRRELVLNGEEAVRAYDPATGRELWSCAAPTGRGEPVPVFAEGRLHVVCGKPGETYCVKPGGAGDVTSTHQLWTAGRKGGRDLPTPAVVDGILLVSSMSGIATAYDAATGEPYFTERLGEGIEVAAAPLVANGLVYFQIVHGGDVVVVRLGKSLEIVARNSLGDSAKGQTFRSLPVPLGDRLLLRGASTLYCVGR
jgi:outer membrane protein assembly factor BamB